ncbi:phosphohistidine phosphatase SixA [Guyparkeria hydrothermalis]|uniref:phosphohistidine phosphatase SixA n=1 Tax=Guyparkeria hydrothermalis TaxID=923 RepID=UPI002021D6C9|nr:phosphohistidine phosphatase SixA [Guyparkeria hydrothermalis]MCL7744883.1 phosphohistidine phosphatase SixA [Guyparkeria hydrothermalis]
MDLLIIRHAAAENREEFARHGRPDSERPLTKRGIDRMQMAARGLTTLALPIERLVSSPAVRALQTAEIVAPAVERRQVASEAVFAPEAPVDNAVEWLRKQPRVEGMAVVGHEPHLGQLAECLIGGRPLGNMPMKKGGVILIRFDNAIGYGEGKLVWALPPAVLRALAD